MNRAIVKAFPVVVLAVFCTIVVPAYAQDELPPALEAHLDGLVTITEAVRQLDTLTPVERAFPTREETVAYLTDLYSQAYPQDELDRVNAFYSALGLLPEGTNLLDVYLTLLGSQVAGFYDTDTQVMNVLPAGFSGEESLSLTEQIIFVHEYVHALQDQHFDLDVLLEGASADDNFDRALALTALVEGDASIAMNFYSQQIAIQNPLSALLLVAESFQAGNLILPEGIPASLVRELIFPYESGLTFALAVFAEGGWDALNAAYTPENQPQTTEQILHPEKYFAGEGADPSNLPAFDIAGALEGYAVLYDTALGEFYLREHLRSGLPASEANRAAAGWGADRFQLLQNNAGESAFMLAVSFDTQADQDEFQAAYQAMLDETAAVTPEDAACWNRESAFVCLTEGDWYTAVFTAPTLQAAQALRAAGDVT
ncbi:MAG: hypothetical protein SF162_07380 [bacterium]|nr:hypothetical protein [bacterium]